MGVDSGGQERRRKRRRRERTSFHTYNKRWGGGVRGGSGTGKSEDKRGGGRRQAEMREGGDKWGREEEEDKKSEERGEDDFLFWAQQPPKRWEGGGVHKPHRWVTTAPPGEPSRTWFSISTSAPSTMTSSFFFALTHGLVQSIRESHHQRAKIRPFEAPRVRRRWRRRQQSGARTGKCINSIQINQYPRVERLQR